MRRRGIQGLQMQAAKKEQFERIGSELQAKQLEQSKLLQDGVCWIDEQAHPHEYWIAAFIEDA
ncbi:hypothetical protein HDU76_012609 [Blyttiomyces sp. JEL0837]|nr:hypothetical protein HDU76_012609 [Blyttiomyces sp. JEL0837]